MHTKHILPFVVTAACALGAAPGAAAANDVQQATSANWSGYVVGGSSSSKTFSSVSGGWTEPTANCSSASSSSYSAFWVGLGGSGSNQTQDVSTSGSSQTSLEQAGTETDCSSDGTAEYFAWYELVPAAPVRLNLAVKPGDKMYTRVSVADQQTTVQLTDKTTGQSVTKTLSSPNPDTSSAEWIAEAPSSCDGQGGCQPLPLTDFGTVQFTNAYATANGHTGSVSDSGWSPVAVQLSPGAAADGLGAVDVSTSGGSAGATPSGLSSDGASFSVAYSDASSTDTSTSGDPYGDGGSGYAYPGGGSGYPGSGSGSDGYGYPGGGYAYVYPGDGYSYSYPGD
jgi:Peptidase A4 family